MTEKLYYQNPYIKEFDAEVIECIKEKDVFLVVLDKTAFFPEGGGQPGDKGFIENVKVVDTQIIDDIIYHYCDNEISGSVHCKIDWDYRFINMQQHTGEQIFTGFVHNEKGYDNVGFHIGENGVTIDFNGPLSKEEIVKFENLANDAIYKNIPVEVIYPSNEELHLYNYRSKKEILGQVRLIKIGDVDLCACCGTHTNQTGEVGIIKVVSSENYKGGVRLTLQIGKKALYDYQIKNECINSLSSSLCVKTDKIYDGVESLKNKNIQEKYEYNKLKNEFFRYLCKDTTENFPAIIYDSDNAEDARILADIIAEKYNISFAFTGNDENGYKYASISKEINIKEITNMINETLNGRGGGKPPIAMGSVSCKKEDILSFLKNFFHN